MTIAKFKVIDVNGTRDVELKMPEFEKPVYRLDSIGDVKFLGVNNRAQINYTSNSFDGWVYANGARYPKSQFPEAYEIYKTMSGSDSTSFVVPVISNFIQPFSDITSENVLSVVPFQNHLRSHTHDSIDGD